MTSRPGARRPAKVTLPVSQPPRRRRDSRALAVSITLHAVLLVILAQALLSPGAMSRIFGPAKAREISPERIGFLRLPSTQGEPVEGRSGGDGRPLSDVPPARVVAPAEVPVSIPPATAGTPAQPVDGGSGPLVGTGGPVQGIRPSYTDPRVWTPPGDIVVAPRSAKEKLDSAVASFLMPFNDSLAVAAQQRRPGDWTFERGGRRYGMDPQFIRLGKVSIPTAVLALLPINQQQNPVVAERNRISNQLNSDIYWQAQRGMNDADFRKAVRSIRERKDRERASERKKAPETEESPAPSDPET